jgi:DNA-binding NarL/FixJ family response regulator
MLVEDHNIVRNGVKALFTKEQDIEVVAEANNGKDATDIIEKGAEIDIVLTDINMPGMDGLTLVKKLSESHPRMRLAVLTMYNQLEYVTQAFMNGAHGYLLKDVGPDELTFAIRHICLRDQQYLCSELAVRLVDRQIQAANITVPDDSEFEFTKKEIEILTLVSEGYTNQEIAERLYTSKRTIEGYRQSLIEKTGVRNSSALIRYAVINGLIR